jgi:adenylylsulfate kinase-like enzyme
LFEPGEFLEVFVDTPVEECRRRDPKGIYARASLNQIANLTGVDDVYEVPVSPELVIKTERLGPNDCVDLVKQSIAGLKSY